MRKLNRIFNLGCIFWPLIISIIAISVAVILQFRDRGCHLKITITNQYVAALRKAMEMYAVDNKNNDYPLELNNLTSINSNNTKLINSLGRYTNVTNLLTAFENDEIKSIKITKNNFTITAKAKDRRYSLFTADASNVYYAK